MNETTADPTGEEAKNARHNAKMKVIQAARAKMMAERQIEKGLLIVHTGAGKGKTTAALGMVCRAIGHGQRVSVIQFIKGALQTGEKVVFDAFEDHVEFRPMGEGFTWDTQDRARDIAVAREAWDVVKARIADPDWDMVVADELNIILRYDYLPLEEVVEVHGQPARGQARHRHRPQRAQALIDAADLVTEMTQVKHPFRSGVKAQAGIEF
jgi:cob(I)alamin adenosyltransferase